MSEKPGKNKLLNIQRQYYKKWTHIQETFEAGRTFKAERTISMDFEEKNDHMNSFYDWSTHDDDRILSRCIQRLE